MLYAIYQEIPLSCHLCHLCRDRLYHVILQPVFRLLWLDRRFLPVLDSPIIFSIADSALLVRLDCPSLRLIEETKLETDSIG